MTIHIFHSGGNTHETTTRTQLVSDSRCGGNHDCRGLEQFTEKSGAAATGGTAATGGRPARRGTAAANSGFAGATGAAGGAVTGRRTAGRGPAANSLDDQLVQIQKLSAMKDQGVITEEEFQAKKKQILGI